MFSVLMVFIVSLLICCAIAYIMAQLWFSDIRNRRLRSFFLLGIEIFFWTLLNAIAMVISPEYFPVIYTLRMVLVCIIPYGVTWFILNFTESPLRKMGWVRNILIIVPAIDILCMATNPLHFYYFTNYIIPMPDRAMIFWIHLVVGFVCVIIGFVILIVYIVKEARRNPWLILTGVGLLIPYIINIMYTFGKIPFPHDITPIGFFVTFMLFVLAAYRSRLFKIKTALFSTTMDSIDDVIIICNERRIINDVNQSALSLFSDFPISVGFTKIDDFLLYLNGVAGETKPIDLMEAMSGDADANGECTLLSADGDKRTYTLSRHTVYEGKSKSGYIFMMADVSEYREMIREIDEKNNAIEQQYKLLEAVNHSANFLLNTEIEGFEKNLFNAMKVVGEAVKVDRVYIWKNHVADGELHCTQVYEWSEGAAPQQGLNITIDISYKENIPGWEETLSSGKCVNNLVRNMSLEEQEQLTPQDIISILVAPVFMDEKFWGFVGFDDCKTERMFTKEEETILLSASLLFAHAYHRSEIYSNLQNTSVQLESALMQANAASKAKGDFLSNMSHEMRTPMNAIIGMTAIGKRADGFDEKNQALSKISDAASHLLGVINDVLDMAKIEADKLELVPIEYNFEKMMQRVAAVINFRIDEKQQHFHINIDNKVPRFIVGDDQRLAQVITNLLSNAVKFTQENGSISIDVDLIREVDGCCELKVEITDSGIGISNEQQSRLFSAFEQAESGTSREYGGTGLGLVISKRIVELMGGSIWVESEFGKGSSFIFTFKAMRGAKSPRSQLSPDTNWKNIRILTVDGMEDTRNQFKSLFNHLEIQCDTAADGIEACRIIEERGEYDLYFVGWQLPDMEGIELTRRIKARENGRQSVVIIITVAGWEKIKDEAAEAGVDRYLFRPVFSSSIIDCVNECIGVKETDIVSASDPFEFAGKRMLLAEDIEINREILMALLENTGLTIDCVENGKEALEMIEAAPPDRYSVVFMDMQMPEMDGLEATRRIRALPALRTVDLPIIAMTANVFKDDIESCLEAGMDDHLGKPLDIDKVLEKLRKYCL